MALTLACLVLTRGMKSGTPGNTLDRMRLWRTHHASDGEGSGTVARANRINSSWAMTAGASRLLCTPYWQRRIASPFIGYDRIVLTLGYPARDDHSRRLIRPWRGYTIKTITHPHFGPDPVKVYAINVQKDPS